MQPVKDNEYYAMQPEHRLFCQELHALPYSIPEERNFYQQKLLHHLTGLQIQRKDNFLCYFDKSDSIQAKINFLEGMKYIESALLMEDYEKRLKITETKTEAGKSEYTFNIDTIVKIKDEVCNFGIKDKK